MNLFEEYLCCPIDEGGLEFRNKAFKCSRCKKKYPVTKEGIHDFLTNFRPIKNLPDYESKWRYRSYRITNSNENKRSREGTFFERLYHRKRIRDYKRIIQDYARNKSLAILDLGTSTGYYKPIFPEDSIRFGVDINMSNLKIQKEYISSGKSQKMNLLHADIYALPFKKKVFDMVTMFVTFHRLKRSVLQEVSKYLKKEGVLIVSVPPKQVFLWNRKVRYFFWKLGLYSNFEGMKDAFELEIRRYSKKDLKALSITDLECLKVCNSSCGMELIAVFKKT